MTRRSTMVSAWTIWKQARCRVFAPLDGRAWFFPNQWGGFPRRSTNANNASICCGTWPKEHGITGNSYFNEHTGEADYMENADFDSHPDNQSSAPPSVGVKSALLTSKVKTIHLLGRGAEIAVAAESPPTEWTERYGHPPNIYSREINYWLWEVAVDILKHRPDIGLLYSNTTDYPMHTWVPEGRSRRSTSPSSIGSWGKLGRPRPRGLFAYCRPRHELQVALLGSL